MNGRNRSDTSPIRRSPTLVDNRVMYCPNYDTKSQDGMTAAMTKVGYKDKPQTNRR